MNNHTDNLQDSSASRDAGEVMHSIATYFRDNPVSIPCDLETIFQLIDADYYLGRMEDSAHLADSDNGETNNCDVLTESDESAAESESTTAIKSKKGNSNENPFLNCKLSAEEVEELLVCLLYTKIKENPGEYLYVEQVYRYINNISKAMCARVMAKLAKKYEMTHKDIRPQLGVGKRSAYLDFENFLKSVEEDTSAE